MVMMAVSLVARLAEAAEQSPRHLRVEAGALTPEVAKKVEVVEVAAVAEVAAATVTALAPLAAEEVAA